MRKPKYCMLNFLFLFLLLEFPGCKPVADKLKSPAGYDLSEPEKFNMPESLLEISGIAFHGLNSDTVYSIQDEDGSLFRQKWGDKKQKHVSFSSKGDFEDLAILKENVFVLKSNGSIYAFPFAKRSAEEIDNVKEWKKILPKGEYESLYADQVSSSLYLLTKTSNEDHESRHSTGYIYNFDAKTGNLSLSGNFEVGSKEIESLGFKIKNGLKTSAITKNPKTKDWYILSSVNKLLVIANEDWKVTSVYHLNSSEFNQPEGIAFDSDLNLYISNEGDELSSGNVLKFKYTPYR